MGHHHRRPDLRQSGRCAEADRYGVRPDYFAAMRIPLLRGRLFTDADGTGAPPWSSIGKTMADEAVAW